MASISSLGVGSGLQLGDILDSLTNAEKANLKPITTQQSAYTAKLSAYGTLSSALTAFQTANSALNSADVFSATTATSSSTAFSATTSGSVVAGKYSINVTKLAQAQTLTSAAQSSNSSALGDSAASRTLTIKLADGSSKDIALTSDQTSLTGMRDAINKANAGVSASIIKSNEGEYRLSLTATKTGEANAVSAVSVSGDDTLQAIVGFDHNDIAANNKLSVSVAAQNAELTVNNIPITSSSNSISDALEGITLNLTATTSGSQTLTVAQDTSKATTAVTNFVNAYNTLLDQFSTLTKYTAVEKGADAQDASNGALVGDSTLRSIQTQIKGLLTNSACSSAYKTLAQIGITSDPTSGKLTLDDSKLKTELAKDPDGIKEMIVGDGKKTGITTRLAENLTGWLATKGPIQTAKDGVSKTLNELTQKYNDMNTRINDLIARYKTQFTQLDLAVSKLNSTSDYLTQQFDSMTSSSKK